MLLVEEEMMQAVACCRASSSTFSMDSREKARVQAAKSVTYAGGKISAGTNKESYRAYYRDAHTRATITVSEIEGADIEASVPPFRNLRVTESAQPLENAE
jgi:hypothetical protein